MISLLDNSQIRAESVKWKKEAAKMISHTLKFLKHLETLPFSSASNLLGLLRGPALPRLRLFNFSSTSN